MKRAKLLCLQNIRFFKDGQLLLAPSDSLVFVESITATIEMQKNDQKHDMVVHIWEDKLLCVQFYNGHASLIESGHIQIPHRILWSVQYGNMDGAIRSHSAKL